MVPSVPSVSTIVYNRIKNMVLHFLIGSSAQAQEIRQRRLRHLSSPVSVRRGRVETPRAWNVAARNGPQEPRKRVLSRAFQSVLSNASE